MLEQLILDLLMTGTTFLLAGWAQDVIGHRPRAGRPLVGGHRTNRSL